MTIGWVGVKRRGNLDWGVKEPPDRFLPSSGDVAILFTLYYHKIGKVAEDSQIIDIIILLFVIYHPPPYIYFFSFFSYYIPAHHHRKKK